MEEAILLYISDSLRDYPRCILPCQLLGIMVYRWIRKLCAEATDTLTVWLKKKWHTSYWKKWVNRVGPLPTSVSHVFLDEDVLEVIIDSSNMVGEDELELGIDSSNMVDEDELEVIIDSSNMA